MAGDWIKMRTTLHENPKAIAVAAATGMDVFAVVGRLHRLWSWVDQHSESGHAVRVTALWIDATLACDGFTEALRAVGWIDGSDGVLTFPDFEVHNGVTGKKRALGASRAASFRNARCVTGSARSGHAKSAPEKRTEEKSISPLSPPTGGQFKRSRRESFEERIARLGRLTDNPGGSQ